MVADAGRPIRLLIETKHPTRYGGLVEKELVRLLQRFGWALAARLGRRRAVAGHHHELRPDRPAPGPAAGPSVPLVLLLLRETPFRRDGSLPAGVHTAGPGLKLLREEPGYVERAHAAGNRVFCWTVDEPADIELVSGLGIDAIITNRPREVRTQLG